MRVYVVLAHYRKPELWFSDIEVAEVFESEADAEAFCASKNLEGWTYTIFGKDIVRNSSAEYKHSSVSYSIGGELPKAMYERYKKFVEGEDK